MRLPRVRLAILIVVLGLLGLAIAAERSSPPEALAAGAGATLAPSPTESVGLEALTPLVRWLDGIHTAETKAYLDAVHAQRLQEARKRAAEARARRAAQQTVRAASAPQHAAVGGGGALPEILWRIARCEGYPTYVYADHGPESTASGKFGFLDGTWRSWRGAEGAQYARAMHAPEAIQDAAAIRLYNASGTTPWNASRSCWG